MSRVFIFLIWPPYIILYFFLLKLEYIRWVYCPCTSYGLKAARQFVRHVNFYVIPVNFLVIQYQDDRCTLPGLYTLGPHSLALRRHAMHVVLDSSRHGSFNSNKSSCSCLAIRIRGTYSAFI